MFSGFENLDDDDGVDVDEDMNKVLENMEASVM
jgi:hypothetical protein